MPNYTYANTIAAKQTRDAQHTGIFTNNYEQYVYFHKPKPAPQVLDKIGGTTDVLSSNYFDNLAVAYNFPDAFFALFDKDTNLGGDNLYNVLSPGFQPKDISFRVNPNITGVGDFYYKGNSALSGNFDSFLYDSAGLLVDTVAACFSNSVQTYVIGFGSLDFGRQSGVFDGIYNGTASQSNIDSFASGVADNVRGAINVAAALINNVIVLGLTTPIAKGTTSTPTNFLANVTDWPHASGLDRVNTVITNVNNHIRYACRELGATFIDLDRITKDFYGNYYNNNNMDVFGLNLTNTTGSTLSSKTAMWGPSGLKHTTFNYFLANSIIYALKEGYNYTNVELFRPDEFYGMLTLKAPYNRNAQTLRYGIPKENFGASVVGGQVGTNNDVPFSVSDVSPSIHSHKDFPENISRSRPGSVTFGAGKATPSTQNYEAKN